MHKIDVMAVMSKKVSRYGWKVLIEEPWIYYDDIVALGDRKDKWISVNPNASKWNQAFAIMGIVTGNVSSWKGSGNKIPKVYESECYLEEGHGGLLFYYFTDFIDYMETMAELYPDTLTL